MVGSATQPGAATAYEYVLLFFGVVLVSPVRCVSSWLEVLMQMIAFPLLYLQSWLMSKLAARHPVNLNVLNVGL